MKIKITNVRVSYHRNGIDGNGFHVVLFDTLIDNETRHMVATVFEGQGNIAILDVSLLAAGVYGFAENSWLYESFEKDLYEAVRRQG
jgi:hypothetical protein